MKRSEWKKLVHEYTLDLVEEEHRHQVARESLLQRKIELDDFSKSLEEDVSISS